MTEPSSSDGIAMTTIQPNTPAELAACVLAAGRGERIEFIQCSSAVSEQSWMEKQDSCWYAYLHYRIAAPKRRMIRVNGVVVPAGETVAPKNGSQYYVPDLHRSGYISVHEWIGDGFDILLLQRGLVYLNSADAAARGEAMGRWEVVE